MIIEYSPHSSFSRSKGLWQKNSNDSKAEYRGVGAQEGTMVLLPIEVVQKSSFGGVEGKYTIKDVNYSFDTTFSGSTLTVVFLGEKSGGRGSAYSYNQFCYKLYDRKEYLVDSGQIPIGRGLSVGDKFKTEEKCIYGLTPGETYKLVLTDFEW